MNLFWMRCVCFILIFSAMPPPTRAAKPPALRSEDVIATVEGRPITRRELTYYWLQADPQIAPKLLGNLLADRWKRDRGGAPNYSIPLSELYAALYGSKSDKAANVLSSLITTRLIAIVAERAGITVTAEETKARAHEEFDAFRKQTPNAKGFSDERLYSVLQLPRDVFLEDMAFRVRMDKLLKRDIEKRAGHSIGPNDWIELRELFVAAPDTGDPKTTALNFAAARRQLDTLLRRMATGKSMEELARESNGDATKSSGGLRGPELRGAGSPAIEKAVFALEPGELSGPVQGSGGWYVFKMERRGASVTAQERAEGWKRIVELKRPEFIVAMRKKAKITSAIPLPPLETP